MPVGLLMCALLSVFSNAGGRDLGLGVAANEDHLAPGGKRTSVSPLKQSLPLSPLPRPFLSFRSCRVHF